VQPDRPKWILNVRPDRKKRRNLRLLIACMHAERMWCTYTNFIKFRSRNGIFLPQESPGISSFFASLLRETYRWHSFVRDVQTTIQRRWENVPSLSILGNAANNSNCLLVATDAAVVSLRSYHYFKWTSYLPCSLAYPLRKRFFSLIFLSWSRHNVRESLFVLSWTTISDEGDIFSTVIYTHEFYVKLNRIKKINFKKDD